MNGDELAPGPALSAREQMKVSARVALAARAGAVGFNGGQVVGELLVLEVEGAGGDERRAETRRSRWVDAIEHVDTQGNADDLRRGKE